MNRLAIMASFLLLAGSLLYAEEAPIEGSAPLQELKALKSDIDRIIDYNAANNSKRGFTAHRSNYLIPRTISDHHEDREKYETKFQISVKQRFLRFYGWAWYIAYTQKSFWQAYNISDSRPFRENNFNPETFIRTKMWNGWRFDLGAEHESNGKALPDSRSWNRIYFTPYFENQYLIFSLKSWYRIPEREKRYPDDPEGDENPDILHYYGYGELGLTLKIADLHLATVSRWNFAHRKGALQADLSYPLRINSMYLLVQYWEGYGESLIDYDLRQRKVGLGFMFTR